MSVTGSSNSSQLPHHDRDLYHNAHLLHLSIQDCFTTVTSNPQGKVNLFTTNTSNLFQLFLDALPPNLRQMHTCVKCRKFVEQYGGIVTINPDGQTIPVLWNPEIVPESYQPAIRKLFTVVAGSTVENVFLSDRRIWGTSVTGSWKHWAIEPGADFVFEPAKIQAIERVIAEKRQDFELLMGGLTEFPLTVVQQAYSLLSNQTLYRSEKCIGVVKWLLDLHQRRQSAQNSRLRDNLTWLAVANAPSGFCHIWGGVIGTLLIAQLQASGALERRFAKLEDLQALWVPHPTIPTTPSTEIFGHLKTGITNALSQIDIPPIVMTWEKFARTILPTAKKIEYFVTTTKQPYVALVTAKQPDAPPIIEWDLEDCRNPVSWYFSVFASLPSDWNLRSDTYCPVTAIVLQPSMWNNAQNFAHHGESVFFILQNARQRQYTRGGGFFPKVLKREYQEIRSTLKAYAENAVVEGKDEATACGIGLEKGSSGNLVFRVTNQDNLRVIYQLDRWD